VFENALREVLSLRPTRFEKDLTGMSRTLEQYRSSDISDPHAKNNRQTAIPFSSLLWITLLAGIGLTGAQPAHAQQEERPARPMGEPLRVARVDPVLEKILLDWSGATSGIQKLNGKHKRFVYDRVFEVEKRSSGQFYYEGPDKGRIDIAEERIPAGAVSRRTNKLGKPFKLQSDQPTRWICNGQTVRQINDSEKTVEIFDIPPERRGANIMDGPLPFLFGMPPDKAKARFAFKVDQNENDAVWLTIRPRWQLDAANWSEARVILDKSNMYLPKAVQLMDTSGNSETVYAFYDMKVNHNVTLVDRLFGDSNPFEPRIARDYKVSVARKDLGVPAVVGQHYKEAQQILTTAGYAVKFVKGPAATDPRATFRVMSQTPQPRMPLDRGKTVTLVLYDRPAQTSDSSGQDK